MIKTTVIYLIIILSTFLKNDVIGQTLKVDSTDLIIDPIEINPFDIKLLSKSIFIKSGTGKAVLRLHINKQGKVIGYDVLKFHLTENNKIHDFTFPYDSKVVEYPNIIKSKDKFIKNYIKNKVIIKRVSDSNLKDDNIFLITVNFK